MTFKIAIRKGDLSLFPRGLLAEVSLELGHVKRKKGARDASSLIGQNDDWQTTQLGGIITSDQVTEIQRASSRPTNAAEAAVIATLAPGSYTAIVRGANNATGNGLVEVCNIP